MSKIFKDEKIFNKFKKDYKFIFKDDSFTVLTQNHFNQNGSFAAFILMFLQTKLGDKNGFNIIKINKDEWLQLFESLYTDNDIKNAYEKLNLNPCVTDATIKKYFNCFDNFIDQFLKYIKEQIWSLDVTNNDVRSLLKSGLGYLLYNSIDCKLNFELGDVINDREYDKKYLMVLNNTKLFADVKLNIRECCGQKINDLLVIILGGSKHLSLDK